MSKRRAKRSIINGSRGAIVAIFAVAQHRQKRGGFWRQVKRGERQFGIAELPIIVQSLPRLRLPAGLPDFDDSLRAHKTPLIRRGVEVLQINIGKKCDLACHHCHVEAGPNRTENMTAATIDRVIDLLADAPDVKIIDITGGAPELNPHFRRLFRRRARWIRPFMTAVI